jgi:adenylate cyclase
VVFCDLRGFTAFASEVGPEEVMGLLGDYYDALGSIIMRYEATLTCFMGDGLMLLLNAPLPCPEPATRAVRMALDMQSAVQVLILRWRERGYVVGFGVGIATGTATVGRIGYEGRIEYSDRQRRESGLADLLVRERRPIDPETAAAAATTIGVEGLGTQQMKGFVQSVPIYAVTSATGRLMA